MPFSKPVEDSHIEFYKLGLQKNGQRRQHDQKYGITSV